MGVMSLNPETLYIIRDGHHDEVTLWVRTPDGVGAYWYDEDDEDALNDVCPVKRRRIFDNMREFDSFRFGGN